MRVAIDVQYENGNFHAEYANAFSVSEAIADLHEMLKPRPSFSFGTCGTPATITVRL